jgi:hypothetical protein
MLWAVGSVLGVLLETIVIIALARPATSQYERELGSAPAAPPEIVRVRRLPAPRQNTENAPSPVAGA